MPVLLTRHKERNAKIFDQLFQSSNKKSKAYLHVEIQLIDNLGRIIENFDDKIRLNDPSLDSFSSPSSPLSSSLSSSDRDQNINVNQNNLPVVIMTTHNLNPFKGKINLSSADRQKMFLKGTDDLKEEKNFKSGQSNVKLIMDTFDMDAQKFGYGSLGNIATRDTAKSSWSILRNFTKVK